MLTKAQIEEFAAEMVDQMNASDRIAFALEPDKCSKAAAETLIIDIDDDGDHYIEDDEERQILRDAVYDILVDKGVIVRCQYCGEDIIEDDAHIGTDGYITHGVPDADNDEAWDGLARQHADDCEWVLTRAHRIES